MGSLRQRTSCFVFACSFFFTLSLNGVAIGQEWNLFEELFGVKQKKSNNNSKRPGYDPSDLPWAAKHLLTSETTQIALVNAIQKYQKIVSAGGWRPIPKGPSLKVGDFGSRVIALKRRLLASGDLRQTSGQADLFDERLESAVKRYQHRLGLTPSGKVNRRTWRSLNVSAYHRLEQLRINQVRIRELALKTQGKRHVIVNIPAYEMQAIRGGRVELHSRVIVGKPHTPTPSIDANIKAVNYLPFWHVPKSIAVRALIPEIKKDINYLKREHIRVYSGWGGKEVDPRDVNWWSAQGERYVFRQDYGPFNALGLVRIDMPNKDIVYMHDTPLKKLFKYYMRPYSAGCVRVERVLELADWLIADDYPDWSASKADGVINSGEPQTIKLKKHVPVYFVYVTAWAAANGDVLFREDIYDRDSRKQQIVRSDEWDIDKKLSP